MRVLAICILAAGTLGAADGPANAVAERGVEAPRRVGITGGERRLTLQQAIEWAIRSNLDVAIERTNLESAEQAVEGARGVFDPDLRWQPLVGDSNTPTPSFLQGENGLVTQHNVGETFSWHEATPWNGLTLDASFGHNRTASADPYVALSPYYTSQLAFTVTQPLLRGRSIDAGRAQVIVRRKQRDASVAQLKAQAIDVAARVERAYWDLVAARRRVEVDTEAADLARVQLDQDRRMIAAGTLAPVELSAAEAELQARMDTLYQSSGAVTEAENQLKALLAHDTAEALWEDEIVPVDTGALAPPEVIELREAMDVAFAQRPELTALDANLAANEVDQRQNSDALKPRMDAVAGYTLAGLAGTVRATADPITAMAVPLYERVDALSAAQGLPLLPTPAANVLPSGGFGSALSNMFRGNYQTFQAGVSFDFTVHNRTAAAALAESAITGKRLKLMRTRVEQAIQADIRNAMQALATARQRMRAADAGTRAAEEKLASETRLFASGESTNFLVLTRQNDYAAARRRQVDAETAFNQAVAQYQAALGVNLRARGIEVE
jgi:hydrophobic/amphiphilic exporter-1 (mainly G- bacteria), HAE1 family